MIAKFVLVFVSYALVVEIDTTISDNSDFSIETSDKESRNPENILCRGCGSDVSSANFLISKLSPSSHYAFNDTLFSREKILVQIVSQDFVFQFPVITTNHSTCQGFGEWQVENSWFPGYRWRLCVCPDCGAFLGWVFESIYPGRVKSPDEVFCLVLTSIIGETCNYTTYFEFYRFFGQISCRLLRTMGSDNLSDQDKEFLASCEEQLKDRYTENDEAFMKVFKAEPSLPPILESWWVPNNGGRRNDRRFNRRNQAYSRDGPRSAHEGSSRGRYDTRGHDERPYHHHANRPRYY